MHSYAQTNTQLYNQLSAAGFSTEDMLLIRRGYDFGIQVFTGRFEQSGKAFISHGVGVASILASVGCDAHVITAGIVHNIYRSGDFGLVRPGITEKKRQIVADHLGERIEGMLYHFSRWTRKFGHRSDEAQYLQSDNEDDRFVVLIAIADQMEKLLDNEVLFFGDSAQRIEELGRKLPRLVAAAEELGYSALGAEIGRRFREVSATRVESVLQSSGRDRFSEVIVPASCRPRWRLSLGRAALRAVRQLRARTFG